MVAINDKGVKLDVGQWWNFSAYAEVPRPAVGRRVRIATRDRWLTAFTILDAPQMPFSACESASAPPSARGTVITRLSVLRTATAFAASRPEAKSTDVLPLAERWLARVLAESAADAAP